MNVVTVAVGRKTVPTIAGAGPGSEIVDFQISESLPEVEADALLFYVGTGFGLLNKFAFVFEAEGNDDDSMRLRQDITPRMRRILFRRDSSRDSAAEIRRLSDPVVAELMNAYCVALVDTAFRCVPDDWNKKVAEKGGIGKLLDFFDPGGKRNARVLYRGVRGTLSSISTTEMSATFVSTTSSIGVAANFGATTCCMFRMFVRAPAPQIDVIEFRDDELHHEEETILPPGYLYRYDNFIEERLIGYANQLNLGIARINKDASLTNIRGGKKERFQRLEAVIDTFFEGEQIRTRPTAPDAVDVSLALDSISNSVAVLGSLAFYSFEPYGRGAALIRKFKQYASKAHDPAHAFIDIRARCVSTENAVKDRIDFGCVYRLVEHWDGIDNDLSKLFSAKEEKMKKKVDSLVSSIHTRLTEGRNQICLDTVRHRMYYESILYDITEKKSLLSYNKYRDFEYGIRDVYLYPQLGNRSLLEIVHELLRVKKKG
tara:strand:+ start:3915 stop:5372 length:1458 start_codon:yes stop_codon:yes gene_type:complete